jgi:ribosomal subunit interface protein
LTAILEKYVGRELSGHVRIEKEKHNFRTNCTIKLLSGLELQSRGEATDAYASADAAFERLEKRLRRYKRRLKDHHHNAKTERTPAGLVTDYVVQAGEEAEEAEDAAVETSPVIVAETRRQIHELSVSDAVMQLDLLHEQVMVFRNAAHGRINIVYQREDGNVGWVDPE